MTDEPEIVELEREDTLRRAERARNALLTAVARVSDDRFAVDPADEWGAARVLRHVVWVEHYWTLIVRRLSGSPERSVEIDREAGYDIGREASRLSGTPEEPIPAPPPYATRAEALGALKGSRRAFLSAVRSLEGRHLETRMSGPRGVVPIRFAVEHVIEHDWDHAVQITALAD